MVLKNLFSLLLSIIMKLALGLDSGHPYYFRATQKTFLEFYVRSNVNHLLYVSFVVLRKVFSTVCKNILLCI